MEDCRNSFSLLFPNLPFRKDDSSSVEELKRFWEEGAFREFAQLGKKVLNQFRISKDQGQRGEHIAHN
jgi:hypothetical protein